MTEPEIKDIFYEIARERGLTLHCDTHYEANNYEFEKWKDKTLCRLNFQPIHKGIIEVTLYVDVFPCCPKLLIWCHNNIPRFPYLAKIEQRKICSISINKREFKQKILELVDRHLQ